MEYTVEMREFVNSIKKLTDHTLDPQMVSRWERAGLFSGVQRGGHGRGVGRWVRFSPEAIFQAAASVQMVHGTWTEPSDDGLMIRYRFDKKVVALIRGQALREIYVDPKERELYPELNDELYINLLRESFRPLDRPILRAFLLASVDIWKALFLCAAMKYRELNLGS